MPIPHCSLHLLLLLLTPAISTPPLPNPSCNPNPTTNIHSCPPFPSPPFSFPFSSSPGCGQPSFQIHCSSSFSLISIHSTSFRLLSILPNNSILLSPFLLPSSSSSPNCPSLPSLNFSPPFHLSDHSCHSLSSLLPCLPTLSSCPPLPPFPSCPRSPLSPPRCAPDILPSISNLLSNGIIVQWNPKTDPYFTNCSACRGLCGFNISSPSKPFLCFPSFPSHPSINPPITRRRLHHLPLHLPPHPSPEMG